MPELPVQLDSFLRRLTTQRPEIRSLAEIVSVEHDGSSGICIPSRTMSRELSMWLWIDGCDSLSITFGNWHTHGRVASGFTDMDDDEAIADLVFAILDGRLVVSTDLDGQYPGFSSVLRIDDEQSVAEAFSEEWSPTRMRIQSWDGVIDQVICGSNGSQV
jgi:hypothetical protein